jgi:hypothetical protein
MIPVTTNLDDIYSGDKFKPIEFVITINAIPLNLTGSSVKMQLRKNITSLDAPAFEFSTANGRIDISSGTIKTVFIPALEIEGGIYRYDLEVTTSTGEVSTYLKGSIKVIEDITR